MGEIVPVAGKALGAAKLALGAEDVDSGGFLPEGALGVHDAGRGRGEGEGGQRGHRVADDGFGGR